MNRKVTINNNESTATIKTFADNPAVAAAFANDFIQLLQGLTESQPSVTVSLSGGSTPKLLFEILARDHAKDVQWSKVHFFWGDERCVTPMDEESNFGAAHELLLSKVEIPDANIHRVHGESVPTDEAIRYQNELTQFVAANDAGVPAFDVMLLGMGGDGHTASIFPHEIELLDSQNFCEVATHPESGQKRITLTGKVLNASRQVFYLITGAGKAAVLAEIISKTGAFESYPTSFVMPVGNTTFYVDESAAAKL